MVYQKFMVQVSSISINNIISLITCNNECMFQSKEELASMRWHEIQACKSEHMKNVAAVLLYYDGLGTNDEILQALEHKYDTLRDKLLLEALRKQLGEVLFFR